MYGCKLNLSASLGSFMVLNGFVFGGGQSRCEAGLRESLGKCSQPVGLSMALKRAALLHWYSGKPTRTDTSSSSLLAPSLQHTGHQIGSNSKPGLRRALHTLFSTLTEPAAPWDWGAPHNCGKAVTVWAVEKSWDLQQILQDRERGC